MDIDHIHFYVDDAKLWRNWFVRTLGFQFLAATSSHHTHTEVVGTANIRFVLSSALTDYSPIAQYLRQHPSGVADLAFRVTNLEAVLDRGIAQGMQLLQAPQRWASPSLRPSHSALKWAQVEGWGELRHTLVEGDGLIALLPQLPSGTTALFVDSIESIATTETCPDAVFRGIDHAVLNVAAGDLNRAIRWYEQTLGFQRQQAFEIHTEYSGLCSQVLKHSAGTVQLPINEPTSASSQIQEFLDVNCGSGVQHVALQTIDVIQTIAQLRQQGLSFLRVPATYYSQLRQRAGFRLSESVWRSIARQEVLVDWQEELPDALLLQAFTQPIFEQPTFFFELIERQSHWIDRQYKQAQGFGAGNFRALFEAIEREQMQRGSLL